MSGTLNMMRESKRRLRRRVILFLSIGRINFFKVPMMTKDSVEYNLLTECNMLEMMMMMLEKAIREETSEDVDVEASEATIEAGLEVMIVEVLEVALEAVSEEAMVEDSEAEVALEVEEAGLDKATAILEEGIDQSIEREIVNTKAKEMNELINSIEHKEKYNLLRAPV